MAIEDVMAQAALRELGAQARTFTSVAAALLWYAEQRARRSGQAIPLEPSGSPRSQDERDRAEATYAKIAGCLTAKAPEDWGDGIDENAVDDLVAWYEVRFGEYADMADEAGAKAKLARQLHTTWSLLCTRCCRSRNVLRRRMQARGLLGEVSGP